jgi:hypothetical protein
MKNRNKTERMTTKDNAICICIYSQTRRSCCYLPCWLVPFICILICRLRLPDWENRRRHNEHSYGFSTKEKHLLVELSSCVPLLLPPLWTRICLVNVELSENALRQYLHWYGRSPEWVRMCVVTDELCENFLPHISHAKGFSPECVRRWAVRFAACVNAFEHLSHLYG